ncbi:MAG: mechanosensitive ion channel [Clostridia bacterium]|nr:mechanosensitive ion channel [Clostridia bacterium]
MDDTINAVAEMTEEAVTDTTSLLTGLWTSIKELASAYAFKFVIALLIVIIGIKLSRLLIKFLNNEKLFKSLDSTVKRFLCSIIKFILYAVVFVSAAAELGIPATSFITILASCGLAIGLALQGSLSNFAGGLMILIFKPFKIGDYIEVENRIGVVHDINIFYTTISDISTPNVLITMPNGSISNTVVKDIASNGQIRLDINVGASYKSDVDKVMKALRDLAYSNEKVLREPEVQVIITKYTTNSIDYQVRSWVKIEDYYSVMFYINENIKKAFDRNGIIIPFAQTDVHIIQD